MSKKERSNPAKVPAKQRSKPDQRIRRTCERLGSALMTLIQEKPIDEVTVQEVLDRARVGRSTFYLHFRDKDDLFLSQLEQFLEMMSTALAARQEASQRVVPVTELFAHIASQKKLYRALADSDRLREFFELAQGYFARGIEQRLKELKRTSNLPQGELAARAYALAASLLALLQWWLNRGAKEPAQTMDDLFHRMVWNGMG